MSSLAHYGTMRLSQGKMTAIDWNPPNGKFLRSHRCPQNVSLLVKRGCSHLLHLENKEREVRTSTSLRSLTFQNMEGRPVGTCCAARGPLPNSLVACVGKKHRKRTGVCTRTTESPCWTAEIISALRTHRTPVELETWDGSEEKCRWRKVSAVTQKSGKTQRVSLGQPLCFITQGGSWPLWLYNDHHNQTVERFPPKPSEENRPLATPTDTLDAPVTTGRSPVKGDRGSGAPGSRPPQHHGVLQVWGWSRPWPRAWRIPARIAHQTQIEPRSTQPCVWGTGQGGHRAGQS